jgi:hypothetical protein
MTSDPAQAMICPKCGTYLYNQADGHKCANTLCNWQETSYTIDTQGTSWEGVWPPSARLIKEGKV